LALETGVERVQQLVIAGKPFKLELQIGPLVRARDLKDRQDWVDLSLRVKAPGGYSMENHLRAWTKVALQNQNIFVWSLDLAADGGNRSSFMFNEPGAPRAIEFSVTKLGPVLGPER
jgi:hypothetical protein